VSAQEIHGWTSSITPLTIMGQRDGETEVGGSQSDETPVATVSKVCVGSNEIPELLSPPHEGADGEGWK